jgi:Ni/Fe-hydrogenase subunit HybB-like protein
MTIQIKIKEIKDLRSLPKFTYILAILTALGMSTGLYRLYAGLGATTNLSTVFPWGVWISFDLTMVAFSGAAFTLAALVYIFHQHDLHAAMRPTVLFGLLGYSSVLVILFFDLGRFDRFWHFLVYPNLTSALFEVSWCIAIYTTILIFEFSPVIFERFNNQKALSIIAKITIPFVIAGITLSSMHQSSLGALFVIMKPRVHPLWYSILTPEFFLTSSLFAGISTIIIGSYLSIWMYGKTLPQKVIEKLGILMPWLLGFYFIIKIGELIFTHELNLLFTSGIFSVLYLTEMVIGVIIPLILFSMKKVRKNRQSSVIAATFVAIGVILNRFDISWFTLKPLNGVTYFPSWIEVSLLIGVFSGVLLVYTLLAHFFPVFSETMGVEKKPEEKFSPSQVMEPSIGD